MAYSLIIIKPDALAKGVENSVLEMITNAGFEIPYIRGRTYLKKDDVLNHYSEHKGKSFLPSVVEYMTSGEAIPAIVSGGKDVVSELRKLVGHTVPSEAEPNTIRAMLSDDTRDRAEAEGRAIHNIIHASGNDDEAKAEIALWFPEVDLNPTLKAHAKLPDGAMRMRFDI